MKYMIMMFGDHSGLEGRSRDWIMEMIKFMNTLDDDLAKSGELDYEEGLADPSQVSGGPESGRPGCGHHERDPGR